MDLQGLIPLKGIKVSVSHVLPYDEQVSLCEIETKKEFSVLTGKKIHSIIGKNEVFLSQYMYDELLVSMRTKIEKVVDDKASECIEKWLNPLDPDHLSFPKSDIPFYYKHSVNFNLGNP